MEGGGGRVILALPEEMISSLSSLHIIFTSLRKVSSTTTSQERLTESPWMTVVWLGLSLKVVLALTSSLCSTESCSSSVVARHW